MVRKNVNYKNQQVRSNQIMGLFYCNLSLSVQNLIRWTFSFFSPQHSRVDSQQRFSLAPFVVSLMPVPYVSSNIIPGFVLPMQTFAWIWCPETPKLVTASKPRRRPLPHKQPHNFVPSNSSITTKPSPQFRMLVYAYATNESPMCWCIPASELSDEDNKIICMWRQGPIDDWDPFGESDSETESDSKSKLSEESAPVSAEKEKATLQEEDDEDSYSFEERKAEAAGILADLHKIISQQKSPLSGTWNKFTCLSSKPHPSTQQPESGWSTVLCGKLGLFDCHCPENFSKYRTDLSKMDEFELSEIDFIYTRAWRDSAF